VLADHFTALERVHEERFEPTHGPLRAAARRAVGRFLDCGLLEHGFARVRCDACRAEFLVAFRRSAQRRRRAWSAGQLASGSTISGGSPRARASSMPRRRHHTRRRVAYAPA
jgi:hypothetical protein